MCSVVDICASGKPLVVVRFLAHAESSGIASRVGHLFVDAQRRRHSRFVEKQVADCQNAFRRAFQLRDVVAEKTVDV